MILSRAFGVYGLGIVVPFALASSPCSSDFDCSSYAPFCINDECVGCRTDADCSSSLVCSTGFCKICVQDSDCLDYYDGTRPYCDDFNCHYCVLDSHCGAATPYCDNGPSAYIYDCKECESDSDCSEPNPHCSQSGSCGSCGSDTHCEEPTPHCTSAGICQECTLYSHCSAPEPNCLYGECRAEECLSDGDCNEPQQPNCEEGACVCFAPHSTVRVLRASSEENIPMTDLKVNDKVLTKSGAFKRVVAFSTYNPPSQDRSNAKSLYVKLTLKDPLANVSIELTPRHMIYVEGKRYPVEASKIKANDSVVFQENSRRSPIIAEVASVKHMFVQGGYAPITEDGTIMVNGIAASCYSNPLYQTSEYVKILGIPVVHRQVFAHVIKSPVRLLCSYVTDWPCRPVDNEEDATGSMHHLPGLLLLDRLHKWAVSSGSEDLGEVLVGLLGLAFFVFEWAVSKVTLLGAAGLACQGLTLWKISGYRQAKKAE